jgi:quercetin dioxygenase-like cupin family protein
MKLGCQGLSSTLSRSFVLFAAVALAQDPVPLDPEHYIVELENARVRVLRVHYGPGEGSPMHEHPAGVGITLTATKSRFQMADGSTREGGMRPAGTVFWREPVRHANRNLMNETAEMIEMDVKGLPDRRAVPRDIAPNGSAATALENDFVRVLRTPVPAGGKSEARKRSESVYVAMNDQRLRLAPLDGKTEERTMRKGQALWIPAGMIAVENTGSSTAEGFIIELKPVQK